MIRSDGKQATQAIDPSILGYAQNGFDVRSRSRDFRCGQERRRQQMAGAASSLADPGRSGAGAAKVWLGPRGRRTESINYVYCHLSHIRFG